MIIESIITTLAEDGRPHIAPMGVIWHDGHPVLAPFRPSATLDNLARSGAAVINHTDDVRVFAGCLTGRRDWPVRPAERIAGCVLAAALAHQELAVERIEEDELRPRFHCRVVHEGMHGAFRGFNRAQAAVIEAAILVSRLHLLARDKVEREIAYLEIAIGKTAGEREREAWGWLIERIRHFHGAKATGGTR
ncbi:MAG TPA: DUF447 domain-containing protein [Stellaceae bacterium]|nr:DUF447 domain-containing protein [Stellaceae bacterium]